MLLRERGNDNNSLTQVEPTVVALTTEAVQLCHNGFYLCINGDYNYKTIYRLMFCLMLVQIQVEVKLNFQFCHQVMLNFNYELLISYFF